jgi:hypothetical protein
MTYDPLTSSDPAVQATLAKLQEARERMRLYGIKTLLEGKHYTPTLTKAAPEPRDNVVQMRKRK